MNDDFLVRNSDQCEMNCETNFKHFGTNNFQFYNEMIIINCFSSFLKCFC